MSASSPKYFKAWIIFFLIATVGGMFIGVVIGAVLGGIMGAAGMSLTAIKIAASAAGFVIGVPVSYFTFRWTVSEFIVKELNVLPRIVPAAPPVITTDSRPPQSA